MKNDGGSAFPVPASDARNVFDEPDENKHNPGMSLRDWFAGQALEGIAKNWSMPCNPCKAMDDAARTAYYLADAMLKACEVPNES